MFPITHSVFFRQKTSTAWSSNWLVWKFQSAMQLSMASLWEVERIIRYGTSGALEVLPWKSLCTYHVAGDIIYVYILGNPIIVINSAQVAEELLEKRSRNYSSRYIHLRLLASSKSWKTTGPSEPWWSNCECQCASIADTWLRAAEWDGIGSFRQCRMGASGSNVRDLLQQAWKKCDIAPQIDRSSIVTFTGCWHPTIIQL